MGFALILADALPQVHRIASERARRFACTGAALLSALLSALLCHPTAAAAQTREPGDPRSVGATAAFGVNLLLGGVTAATRAWIEGHDPVRAFAIGAVGGAVHFAAKLVGPGTSLAGVAVGVC